MESPASGHLYAVFGTLPFQVINGPVNQLYSRLDKYDLETGPRSFNRPLY